MPTTIQGVTFYTITEAAKELQCTKQTIRNYLKSGKLKGHRIGHPVYITELDIKNAIQDYKPRPHSKDGKY